MCNQRDHPHRLSLLLRPRRERAKWSAGRFYKDWEAVSLERRGGWQNCCVRCWNFVRGKSKLFWLLFLIKTICFMAEIGIYTKQADFISSTNYSAAMTKFNGSLEAFEEEKEEHLSEHQIEMFGLFLRDLVILAFIFVEAGPYLWSLIGRLLKFIHSFCRRALWCVEWENHNDDSREAQEEIKHSIFATFLVTFMPRAIVSVVSLDLYSIILCFYNTAAWIVAVGTFLLVMKLPNRISWLILWMISVAQIYVSMDVIFHLTEHRKMLPNDSLQKELRNFSIQVGFDPTHIYVTKNVENDNLTAPAYTAGIFFHQRIVFLDTAIGYSYDKLGKEDDPALNLLDASEELHENNGTTFNIQKYLAMYRRRRLRSKINRMILSIYAHEISHWTNSHVAWKNAVLAVDRLLMVLLLVALCKHRPLYTAFGFKNKPILVGAIIILYMVAAPYNFFKAFLVNWISQAFERQADQYTTTVGLGSEFCFVFSAFNNHVPFQEDWLFSLYEKEHPPFYERLRALNCTRT
ncbi:peptidase family m48 domain-containing protein [Ditylenchus destructor]|uniref:Peptidase family m48 domain-containing protein n=1 Tax=Ditylenchus destructor TaxID=166010 RepID=A0AAD4MLM6_9BILA|nr:peptidase family m48 domain-containing protein [Ditylenchus destructor]